MGGFGLDGNRFVMERGMNEVAVLGPDDRAVDLVCVGFSFFNPCDWVVGEGVEGAADGISGGGVKEWAVGGDDGVVGVCEGGEVQ